MNRNLYFLVITCCVTLLFTSCSKDVPDNSLSVDIKNIAPDSILAKVRAAGMIINTGNTPPVINGIYQSSPFATVFDNTGRYAIDYIILDTRYKFHDQDNSTMKVKYDFKTIGGSDEGYGEGAFLAGSGNKFTAFIDVNGVINPVHFKSLVIISGEITSTGIKNFYYSTYIKSKESDPTNKVAKVGALRIFKDKDGIAEKLTDF